MTASASQNKRVRIRRGPTVLTDDKKAELELAMELWAKKTKAVNKARDELAELQEEIFYMLTKVKEDTYSSASADAAIKTTKGRNSTKINVELFREACDTDEDFLAACKIGVTDAKKVLSGKELERVSVITKGADGDPELSIKLREAK